MAALRKNLLWSGQLFDSLKIIDIFINDGTEEFYDRTVDPHEWYNVLMKNSMQVS